MTIGYMVTGHDNDSYMLDDKNQALEPRCPKCGFLVDFNYHNPFYKLRKMKNDLSHPYDVGCIVSLRFKEFCEREQYENILFKQFERESDIFHMVINNVLNYDIDRSDVELNNYCERCKNYEEVLVPSPVHLKEVTKPLADGFYRTDLAFGSGDSKNYLIIIGVNTYEKLKREKMKGLIYEPIELG